MIRQMEEDDAILLTAVMDSTGLQAEEQEPINCYECYQRVYLSSASRNSNGEKIFCG